MEDKKLNEKESLELITQMIQNTRRNLDAGSGNIFLVWGYASVLITLVVWAGLQLTKNPVWMWGFWGIPVVGYMLTFLLMRKRQKPIISYVDAVLKRIWWILGWSCMVFIVYATGDGRYEVILPLCAIVMSLGSIITGCVIRYTSFFLFPILGLLWGTRFLFEALSQGTTLFSLIEFAAVIIFSMIIPGHILNYKARKDKMR